MPPLARENAGAILQWAASWLLLIMAMFAILMVRVLSAFALAPIAIFAMVYIVPFVFVYRGGRFLYRLVFKPPLPSYSRDSRSIRAPLPFPGSAIVDGTQLLPRAVLRGENLYLGDGRVPYTRLMGYPVSLNITGVTIRTEVTASASAEFPDTRVDTITGTAAVLDGDKFAVAGLDVSKTGGADLAIAFHFSAVSDDDRKAWQARITFARMFSIRCTIPKTDFDRISANVRAGAKGSLVIQLDTTMWTEAVHTTPQSPLTFYLLPYQNRDVTTPCDETASIINLTWMENEPLALEPPRHGLSHDA